LLCFFGLARRGKRFIVLGRCVEILRGLGVFECRKVECVGLLLVSRAWGSQYIRFKGESNLFFLNSEKLVAGGGRTENRVDVPGWSSDM
jgi:hypothetical protein